tara:strand:- start:354 stop:1118 length:765 start_codon:yes stop_codon:yes gene_type:complete
MHDVIKDAVTVSQRAQRNYNLTKSIPQKDLDCMIYAASNGPSKQNETHFNLRVFTDKDIIKKIHDATKVYALFNGSDVDEVFEDQKDEWGEKFHTKETHTITNSQIYANAVFVFCDDQKNLRGGTHILATREGANEVTKQTLFEQKAFSVGIASGQLAMAAAMLGYKTGFCSAFERVLERTTPDKHLQTVIQSETEPRLIIGIGHSNPGINRLYHATVKNKDIPVEFRTGPEEEYFKHKSLDKELDVWLNNKKI